MTRTTRTTRWERFWARLLAGLLLAPNAAVAAPAGENVVRGNVTITRDGADTTVRASNRSIIEWSDFDIGAAESVRFVQPSRRARVLNRVTGPDSTEIDGALRANGIVYIVNPYGIYFGDTAVVDVAQLIAAAGEISNADFVAGVDRFTELGGAVENLGSIEGRAVTLLGASVANHGRVEVPNGRIWLLAGDEVIVAEHGSPIVLMLGAPAESAPSQYAVANTGTLDAGNRGSVRMAAGDLLSLAIHNAGTVRARDIALAGGEGSRVQVEGVLDASNAVGGPVRDGGTIDIRGDAVFVQGAVLDASGRRGGGTIHVGGDVAGVNAPGDDGRNSQLSYVSDDAVLRADALLSGDGGEVVVWSDGASVVDGAISARGAERSGDGGFVETSGRLRLAVAQAPDVSAPNGRGGDWLLDPANVDIVGALTVATGDARDLTDEVQALATSRFVTVSPQILPVAGNSEILGTTLERALARGINVTISTELLTQRLAKQVLDEGNIRILTSLGFANEQVIPETTSTLRLRAANRIELASGQTVSDSGSNLALTLDFESGDDDQVQLDAVAFDPVTAPGNESIDLQGGIDVKGQVLLRGARVTATQDMSALAITVDARDAIDVQGLATDGGIARLDSANGGISIGGDVTTNGGTLLAAAVRGDLALTGDVETRIDPTDDESLGGSVQLTATAALDTDDDGDPVPDPAGAQGGTITLTGTTLRAGGSVLVDAGRDLTVAHSIETSGGSVTLQLTDNPRNADLDGDGDDMGANDSPFVADPQTLTMTGDIVSRGGDVFVQSTLAAEPNAPASAVDLVLAGDVNASDDPADLSDPTARGDVVVRVSGDASIAAGVDLVGESVELSAGLGGLGDLAFGAGTTVDAVDVLLEAGDGYSRDILPTDSSGMPNTDEIAARALSLDSRVQLGGATGLTLTGTAMESVSLVQDGALAAGDLGTSALDLTTVPDVVLQSRDRTVTLDASDVAKLAAGAGTSLSIGAATDVDLQAALDAEVVDIAVAESFAIDQAFADAAAGASTRELRVAAGTQGGPSDGELFAQVNGDLTVADGVVLRASDTAGQSQRLELHGGANGAGSLGFVGTASLQADEIVLRAGDGTGTGNELASPGDPPGANPLSDVRFASGVFPTLQGDGGDFRFELRQDETITASAAGALPALTDPGPGLETTYALRSDDGDIVLRPGVEAELGGKHVELVANAFDVAGLAAEQIDVASLDIGGVAGLRVTDALLAPFGFANDATSRTTLRAGVDQVGTLSFASGTTVASDEEIRLVAGDGVGGNVTSLISLPGATFRKRSAGLESQAPDRFVLEQDAGFTSSQVPTAARFGNGDGTATPDILGLRSLDGAILLSSVPTGVAQSKLVLAGPVVSIERSNGDVNLDSSNVGAVLDVRADQITLRARNTGSQTAQVLPGDARFAGHDTAEGGVDEGDLDVAVTPGGAAPGDPLGVAPAELTIRQDADLVASLHTPDRAQYAGGGIPDLDERKATLLQLIAEEEAEISFDDASRVQGFDLALRLFDFDADSDRTVSLLGAGAFDVHGLDIEVPGTLVLDPITVTATDSVRIAAGSLGRLDRGDTLAFAAGSSIAARTVQLEAGSTSTSTIEIEDAATEALVGIDASQLDVALVKSDPDDVTSFFFEQDASFGPAQLPRSVTATETVGSMFFESRRGNATVDVDALTANVTPSPGEPPISSLVVNAGTFSLLGVEPEEVGVANVHSSGGDLDLVNGFDSVVVQAREIELEATSPGAAITAGSDDVRLRGTVAATPNRVTLRQDAPFDVSFGNDAIVRASQLVEGSGVVGSALGVDYRLVQNGGTFRIESCEDATDCANRGLDPVATQLAAFDLTVDVGPTGTIVLDASADTTPPPGNPMSSPRFFGLHAKAGAIDIQTPAFSTLTGQSYEGAVTLGQDTALTGTSVLFGGTVQGAADGAQSLTVNVADKAHFASGVGNDGMGSGGAVPTAMNRLANLFVNFIGGTGELELGSSADVAQGQDVFGAGSISTALADLDTTSIDVTGDVVVQAIDIDAFAEDQIVSARRSPVPRRATVYQRGVGTLAINAGGDVRIGGSKTADGTAADGSTFFAQTADGEKVTAPGTLAIDAAGDVVVGDLTADTIQIAAQSISVQRRPAASVRRPGGGFERDGGVEWVANAFQLTTTGGTGAIGTSPEGRGNPLVIASSSGRPTVDGTPIAAPLFAINPDHRALTPQQLYFDGDPNDLDVAPLVLDARAAGPSTSNLTEALDEAANEPDTTPRLTDPAVAPDAFREIGITTHDASGSELVSRTRASAIFDDASRGWRSDRAVARLTATRLDAHNAREAKQLFLDVLGPDLRNAPAIRATLANAVAAYQAQTGTQRVLGFELRRFLKNRPSTQFDAYQVLEALDRLFSAHRRTGLVPAEYTRVQREWIEAIAPPGITSDELAEAIHPSRYVRGSDVLDVFGD